MAVLKPVGEDDAAVHLLDQETVTIGRDASNALVLRDMASSSRHARLVKDENGWRMEDLGSSNGTFVNGWRIETVRLNTGDRLQIGASEFTFEDASRSGPDRASFGLRRGEFFLAIVHAGRGRRARRVGQRAFTSADALADDRRER